MSASPRACPATTMSGLGASGLGASGLGASGLGASGLGASCPERGEGSGCPAGPAAALLPRALLPLDGAERAVMLALRYVAAAAETGDAACFDAAFDGAEAAFGPRDGALLVARAAALVRAIRRDEAERDGGGRDGGGRDGLRFLPPPCRRLSAGEAHLLAALRLRLSGRPGACAAGLSGAARAALADLAAPIRSAGLGLPLLPAPGLPERPQFSGVPD